MAQQKLREKEILSTAYSYEIGKSAIQLTNENDTSLSNASQSSGIAGCITPAAKAKIVNMTAQADSPGQRTSLPDITLTPK